MLSAGDRAPEFELFDHHGDPISLGDFAGQWVVVYFYPRADTSGCTTEACEIRDAWKAFEEREIAVLGISDDPLEDLEAFAEKYDLPFYLLSDESGAVAEQYGSYGEKHVFGNTTMGVFRKTFVIGPDGTVENVYENVTPEGHAAQLLEDIPSEVA